MSRCQLLVLQDEDFHPSSSWWYINHCAPMLPLAMPTPPLIYVRPSLFPMQDEDFDPSSSSDEDEEEGEGGSQQQQQQRSGGSKRSRGPAAEAGAGGRGGLSGSKNCVE